MKTTDKSWALITDASSGSGEEFARTGHGFPGPFLDAQWVASRLAIQGVGNFAIHARAKAATPGKTRARLQWLARPVALFALSCVVAVAFSGCSRGHPQETSNAPALVKVVEVAQEHSEESAHYTGVIRARTESSLGFRVAGKVTERLVNAGDSVRQGQPLLRLDSVDFHLALRAAQAAVEAARAVQTQASSEEERVRTLVEKRAESQDALEKATAAAERSAAQLRSAEAQANQVANQSSYTTVYADSNGVVMTTLAEPGQVVAAGQTVIVLARDAMREAAVDIPESSLGEIRNQIATAQLYANKTASVRATLREVSGVADPISRTYQARYVIEDDPKKFPLGATVTVRLAPAGHESRSVIEVPLGSLIDRGDSAAVWVVAPRTSVIEKRPVSIAKLGLETARISEGLQPGDIVVSLGAHLLNSGQVVRVTESSAKETQLLNSGQLVRVAKPSAKEVK